MAKISQFYKTILLLTLSVILFLGFKAILPERLFPESSLNDPSMLIDSVLLALLDGEEFVEPEFQGYDSISIQDKIIEPSKDESSTNISSPQNKVLTNDEEQVLVVKNGLPSSNRIKPFRRSNFSQKLEKRKPLLFIPEENNLVVLEHPIIDTLLDPTISVQGYGYLQRFYSKLKKLEDGKSEKVRVAYFGDSMNDGDLIVQDFRAMLQDSFGGNGVGFVSIASLSSASRGSVFHQHSDSWHIQSFITAKTPSTPFGIDGQVFLANGGNGYWVSYTAGGMKNSPMLYSPTLFYGRSDNNNASIKVSINNEKKESFNLNPSLILNTQKLGVSYARTVKVDFENIQNIPLYGLDFSSHSGVHVDNFSLRGNSGLTLAGFNTQLMNAFDRVLNYDLIVLHYGTNVLNYGSKEYDFYEKGMKRVINKLRACFPNADILVVSTADKASKIDMKMVTDPSVISLTKAQKKFSRDTGCGYIDLYNLMGGYGSMVDWVDRQLANKDYTHFNVKGSKEVGALLFKELEQGYNKYKIQLNRDITRGQRED